MFLNVFTLEIILPNSNIPIAVCDVLKAELERVLYSSKSRLLLLKVKKVKVFVKMYLSESKM